MPVNIRFSDIQQTSDSVPPSSGSAAPRLGPRAVNIQCRLSSDDPASLEALRYARRAMLREEWTRGIEPGEPSLDEAVFSTLGLVWRVPEEERESCLAKLDELLRRANQALLELSADHRG
jgi:hypothetical protein